MVIEAKDLAAVSDEELMRMVQADSDAAFSVLYERYHEKVVRHCYGILRNPDDAADAAQDTFQSVFRARAQFAYQSAVSTWIYRIAHNAALMALRRKQGALRVAAVSYDEHEEALSVSIRCPRPLPDEEFVSVETGVHIAAAINGLTEEYRTVFVMREVLGMSIGDIAVRLGITILATKSRLHRAREAVRKALRRSMK